MKGVVLNP